MEEINKAIAQAQAEASEIIGVVRGIEIARQCYKQKGVHNYIITFKEKSLATLTESELEIQIEILNQHLEQTAVTYQLLQDLKNNFIRMKEKGYYND